MRLRQIKISGFKSFADPVTLEFPSNACGIVGPNGCGKSNIIDAVRWVLGEARLSELRGTSAMSELIFAGSEGRPASSRASVELLLDNSDGALSGPWGRYGELAIRRVMSRDGANSYSINGQPARRRDVQDIFLGTGLGPRSYAIISQGTISRFISARPEDLRVLLEEAAGVSRYRERRRETQSSLAATRANLEKVALLQAGKAEEVARLEEEARAARHWQELERERVRLEGLLGRAEYLRLGREIETDDALIRERQAVIDRENTAAGALREGLPALTEAARAAREAAREAQSRGWQAQSALSEAEAAERARRERAADLERAIAAAEEKRGRDRKQRAGEARAVAGLAEEARAQDEKAAELEARAAALSGERARQEERLAEARRAAAARRDDQAVLERRRALARAACDNLRQRGEEQRRRLDELARERVEQEPEEDDPGRAAALARARRELAAARELDEAGERALSELGAALGAARAELDQARAAETAAEARLRASLELQERQAGAGDLPAWRRERGLEGEPLYRRLRVAPEHAVALAAALGDAAAALPLGDPGRLPELAAAPPPERQALSLPAPAAGEDPIAAGPWSGCPPLLTLVSAAAGDDAAFLRDRLRGHCLAPDLARALALRSELPPGVTLVTPVGELVSAAAVTLGAERGGAPALLVRESENEERRRALARLAPVRAAAESALRGIEGRAEEARAELAERREATLSAQRRLHELELEESRRHAAAEARARRLAAIAAESRDLTERQAALGEELERAVAAERELAAALPRAGQELAAAEELARQAETTLELTRGEEGTTRERAQEARLLARAAAQRGADARARAAAAAEEGRLAERELAGLRRSLAELSAATTKVDLTALRGAAERGRQAEDEARRDADAAEGRLAQARDELERLQRQQGPLLREVSELMVRRQDRLARREALAAGLPPEALAEAERAGEGDAPSRLAARLERARRELAELGPVNHAAPPALERARAEMERTAAQLSDLDEAIANLESGIRRIDAETRGLLKDTFAAVNASFATTFASLLGGGSARLEMTPGEILECGVEVFAQPPGKKNKSIRLLSGGEQALAATALVLAIFRLNPAPFCLLDEVDAPLDDANQLRLVERVLSMSAETQFVMVTHHRVTMEHMSQLIGVTMREPGVSRVVAVDLAEASALAA